MSDGKGRPVQPKCEQCGKALYKRMDSGGVKTTDPYGWCRNAKCSAYNTDQSGESRFAPIGGAAPDKAEPKPKAEAKPSGKPSKAPKVVPPAPKKAPPKPDKAKAKARAAKDAAEAAKVAEDAAAAVGAASEASEAPEGSTPLDKARHRIGLAMKAVEKTYSKAVIGLTLAIVSQEMGSHEAANALIREYDLTEQYGIEPKE